MKIINNFLNNTTMYRLVLYCLLGLCFFGFLFSVLGLLTFNPMQLTYTLLVLLGVGWLTNKIFARIFEVDTNLESVYISVLILSLIVAPAKSVTDIDFLFWVAVLTISSKFILNLKRKHIFNPVALAIFLTATFANQSATWWIGNKLMLIPVLVSGLLIVSKIKRFRMVTVFLLVSLLLVEIIGLSKGFNAFSTFKKLAFDSPWLFFAIVMFTEPLTTPPKDFLRLIYAGLTGFLFLPQLHIGSIYSTPEIALLLGNIFSYLVSPKERLLLTLREKIALAPNIFDFVFDSNSKLNFLPGQYLEWTIKHNSPDSRGNRRYFTIASSPTENNLRIGVKFYERSSSYKQALLKLMPGDKITASQLEGDFVLPKNTREQLVLIAGGIGITPFRSMLKFLVDKNEHRSATVFYAVKNAEEFVYRDVLKQAEDKLGIKTIELTGRLTQDEIKETVPNYINSNYYISGPPSMVDNYKKTLLSLGVHRHKIKTDYFPGFA